MRIRGRGLFWGFLGRIDGLLGMLGLGEVLSMLWRGGGCR